MSPPAVSVVISPPAVDLDSYEPFDGQYTRTVDEILSDEPSFDASFDAYNSGISMDGSNGSLQRERAISRASVGKRTGPKKSPYFSTGQMSQRRIGSKRSITRIDVDEDDDDDEDEDEDDITPATSVESVKIQVVDNNIEDEHHDNKTYAKANGNAVDDDIAEEDIVFASVGPEVQARLLNFIASHSFMRSGSYPVRRSKRRTFVCELYEQAKSTGMDEHSIDRLTNYVRKTYLELYGKDYVDTQGSEFGDEIDDVGGKRRRSLNDSKKDRKRKRLNGDAAKQKHKKSRSQSSQEKRTTSTADSHNNSKREVIDLEAEYPLADFSASATEPEGFESKSTAEELPRRRPSISKQSGRSSNDDRSNDLSLITPENRNSKASVSIPSRHSLRSPANSKDEPIFLESDSDGPRDSATAVPKAHSTNPIHSDKPTTREESIARAKKEKNHRKRRSRRRKRAERYRENLKDSQIQNLAAEDRHIEEDATTNNTDDSQSVTASDEVTSKYFTSPQQVDGLASSVPSQIPTTYFTSSVRDYEPIPEKARQILTEVGLSFDILASDSESDLSDVQSDDGILDHDAFLRDVIQPPVLGETFDRSAEGIPKTPLKSALAADPDVPFVMALRPRPPKVSPYFPKPLIDPDSCLPFPSIDAPTFGLVQEQLAHDPFRLLIATIFLNRTRGGVALPVLFQVFEHFPTAQDMSTAEFSKLVSMIHSLGFQNERARKCIDLAKTWLERPPTKGRRYRRLHYPRKMDGKDVGRDECIGDDENDTRVAWEIAHLPGVGPYSLDSWRIFCRDELRGLAKDWKGNGAASADFEPEWKSVLPQDKELRAYLTWMWLKEGWIWDRHTGERKRASEKMMRAARRGGVAQEQDGNFVLEMSPVKKVANGLTAWS
ncbi:hypothetical protein KXW60_009280 [Aspergillus fumigatus]|nr:hypothetical protein KXW60_009280 [Aspergillus fumigatus]KAH3273036.1 hypothetical protein KXW55_009012 [Aspergillus fumigatus]